MQRQILVENPSSYIGFTHSTMSEADFLAELAHRTGCKLLLDINNIYVQAHNHGTDMQDYLSRLDADMIGEYHLAGHINEEFEGELLLIDTHSERVKDEVWELYNHALHRFGIHPTLIEWDKDIPSCDVLLNEAAKAQSYINSLCSESIAS